MLGGCCIRTLCENAASSNGERGLNMYWSILENQNFKLPDLMVINKQE